MGEIVVRVAELQNGGEDIISCDELQIESTANKDFGLSEVAELEELGLELVRRGGGSLSEDIVFGKKNMSEYFIKNMLVHKCRAIRTILQGSSVHFHLVLSHLHGHTQAEQRVCLQDLYLTFHGSRNLVGVRAGRHYLLQLEHNIVAENQVE